MSKALQSHVWNLADILLGKSPYALLLLNHAVSEKTAASLTDLWCKARVRVCVDGATNGYHEYIRRDQVAKQINETNLNCEESGASKCNASTENQVVTSCAGAATPGSACSRAHESDVQVQEVPQVGVPLPDFICGDFDSAKPELLQHYSQLGVPVIKTQNQNFTDFSKALKELSKYLDCSPSVEISYIIVAVEISAVRFDHVFANINTLHKVQTLVPRTPMVLVSRSTVQLLLPAGESVITPSGHTDPECNFCAYIPLCGPSTITTTGLKWDVENATAQFGGLVSTSNQFASGAEEVHITTDKPLLFIMNTPVAAAACSCDGGRLAASSPGTGAAGDN